MHNPVMVTEVLAALQAEARRTLRRRDARWGWTRGSHFGRELAEWVVVRMRSRWRGD